MSFTHYNSSSLGVVLSVAMFLLVLPSPAKGEGMQLKIDIATTETVSGQNLGLLAESTQLNKIFELKNQLVYKIADLLGVSAAQIPASIKAAIEKPPTEKLEAFLSFSKGLDLMDQGQFATAKVQFALSIEQDPNFLLAKTLVSQMPNVNITPESDSDGQKQGAGGKAKGKTSHAKQALAEMKNKSKAAGTKTASKALATASSSGGAGSSGADSAEAGSESSTAGESSGSTGTMAGSVLEAAEPPEIPDIRIEEITQNQEVANIVAPDDLGFYATFLMKGSGGNWKDLIDNPYINTGGLTLESGSFTMEQAGNSGGFLSGTASGEVGSWASFQRSWTAFKEGQSGDEATELSTTLTPRTVNSSFANADGTTHLELGQYQFSGWESTCSSGSCQYHWDRLYFAEGTPTSEIELQTLMTEAAQNATVYNYNGVAAADIIHYDPQAADYVLESSVTGTFQGQVNFGTSRLNNMTVDITAGNHAASIDAGGATITPDGAFAFDHTLSEAVFRVGDVSQGSLSAADDADFGQVGGQMFGNKAAGMGGTFAIHRGDADDEWMATGNFGGTR